MKTTKHTVESLNAGLYAAAKKAGMVDELYFAQVEVCRDSSRFYVTCEREVEERGDRRIDYKAVARAEAWLAATLSR